MVSAIFNFVTDLIGIVVGEIAGFFGAAARPKAKASKRIKQFPVLRQKLAERHAAFQVAVAGGDRAAVSDALGKMHGLLATLEELFHKGEKPHLGLMLKRTGAAYRNRLAELPDNEFEEDMWLQTKAINELIIALDVKIQESSEINKARV